MSNNINNNNVNVNSNANEVKADVVPEDIVRMDKKNLKLEIEKLEEAQELENLQRKLMNLRKGNSGSSISLVPPPNSGGVNYSSVLKKVELERLLQGLNLSAESCGKLKSVSAKDVLDYKDGVFNYLQGKRVLFAISDVDVNGDKIDCSENTYFNSLKTEVDALVYNLIINTWPSDVVSVYKQSSNVNNPRQLWDSFIKGVMDVTEKSIKAAKKKMKGFRYQLGTPANNHTSGLEKLFSEYDAIIKIYNDKYKNVKGFIDKTFSSLDKKNYLTDSVEHLAEHSSFQSFITSCDGKDYEFAKEEFRKAVDNNVGGKNPNLLASLRGRRDQSQGRGRGRGRGFNSLRGNFSQEGNGRRNNGGDVICHNCGKPGHYNKQCSEPAKDCYSCNKKAIGHISTFCKLYQGNGGRSGFRGRGRGRGRGRVSFQNQNINNRNSDGESKLVNTNQNEANRPAFLQQLPSQNFQRASMIQSTQLDPSCDFVVNLDGGSDETVFHNKLFFTEIHELPEKDIYVAQGIPATNKPLRSRYRGTVKLENVNGSGLNLVLVNVVYAHDAGCNVVAESQLEDSGFRVNTAEDFSGKVVCLRDGKEVFKFPRHGGHYALQLVSLDNVSDARIINSFNFASVDVMEEESLKDKFMVTHSKLAHAGIDKLIELASIGQLDGMSLNECYKVKARNIRCSYCDAAKIKTKAVNVESKHPETKEVLGLASVDVLEFGDIDYSIFKYEYVSTFKPPASLYVSGILDDKSKFVEVKNLNNKGETVDHVIEYLKKYGEVDEDKVPVIKTIVQGDGAYKTNKLQTFCNENGFKLSICPPHSHHNVQIENYWRSLLSAMRANFDRSGAPIYTLCFNVKYSNFCLNQLTSVSVFDGGTKYQQFHGKGIRKDVLHSFGCDVMVKYEENEKYNFGLGKLDTKGYKAMFLGIDENDINFDSSIVYDLLRNRIVIRRNCNPFYENEFTIAKALSKISLKTFSGQLSELVNVSGQCVGPEIVNSEQFILQSSVNLDELLDYESIQEKAEEKQKEERDKERKEDNLKELVEKQIEVNELEQINKQIEHIENNDRNNRIRKRNELKENLEENKNENKSEMKLECEEKKVESVNEGKESEVEIKVKPVKTQVPFHTLTRAARARFNSLNIDENINQGFISLKVRNVNFISKASNLIGIHHKAYVSYEEAMNGPYKEKYEEAIEKERETVWKFDTFSLMNLKDVPEGATILGTENLLNPKYGENGKIVKFKSRIVVRGDHQKEGDYDEISSPVLDRKSFRVILSLAVENGLLLFQFDITNAYLHADIDKEIYVKIPPGFPGFGDLTKIYKLNKALYGTKQAGYLFNVLVTKKMIILGFTQSKEDYCLFCKRTGSGNLFIVGIYVDDNTVAIHPIDKGEFEEFIKQLRNTFKIEDVTDARWILGMKINYDIEKGILELTQQAYIEKLLERFKMTNANPAKTPAVKVNKSNDKIKSSIQIEKVDREFPYLEAVGSLLYLAICTRPEILYAVNYCAQHSINPTSENITAVKRIMRYLIGTKEKGLVFKRSVKDGLKDDFKYSITLLNDAAFDVSEDSKSQSGYFILINRCNIFSNSRKQNIIAQSSMEAEYIAGVEGSNEAIGIKYLIEEIVGKELNPVIKMRTDSKSVEAIVLNQKPKLIRHINRKYNVLKERVKNKEVIINYLPTDKNVADLLTKPLEENKFIRFRDLLLGYNETEDY